MSSLRIGVVTGALLCWAIPSLAGCGSTTHGAVECPAGSTWNGSVCVGEVRIECPPGTTPNGDVCSPPVVAASSEPIPSAVVAPVIETPPSAEPLAPAAPSSAPAPSASASSKTCGCAPGDLSCSMKCSAKHAGPNGTGSPMPTSTPPPPPTDPFDRGAASAALSAAGGNAKGCKTPTGPTGSGKVTLIFAPTGLARTVSVSAPYAGTPMGACIVQAFKGVRVPPFTGGEITVTKPVSL